MIGEVSRRKQRVQQVVWEEFREGVGDEVREESEGNHSSDRWEVIDGLYQKLDAVQRKVNRTDVMVWTMVRQGLGGGHNKPWKGLLRD